MANIINWFKRNWALSILIIVVLNWFLRSFLGVNTYRLSARISSGISGIVNPTLYGGDIDLAPRGQTAMKTSEYYPSPVAPTDNVNRMVIQDTSLSLQVKNVENSIKSIEDTAKGLGGYLVDSFLSKPESAASGNITVRVPEDKRAIALESFKNLSVKVVSESVHGVDVTDQYVDIESRLAILNQTKQKYQEIMDRAVTVNDLMNVQSQLINLQSQIDNLRGQQKYLEQSAKLTKIVIYLSTDDLSLPYSPTNVWRPAVVFKTAVRSLVGTFRSLGTLIIWLAVYSPIVIPIIILVLWYKRRQSSNS